jgi:glycosyltransferase involved in cell wall biosynthesis
VISFVVPAHNEEACLPATLRAIQESARATGQPFEIIVANDVSTDATAKIAMALGARVINVNHRQIAATRNSGARAALGERIFFVDADTTINSGAVKECLEAMDKGAIGGGGLVIIEGKIPLFVKVMEFALYLPAKLGGFCGGAFMYCTREAFHATGGFNEKVYWGEEAFFGFALKRLGPFVVIWRRVITSGRRVRSLPGREAVAFFARAVFHPIKIFTDRSFVQKIWYNSNRQNDNVIPNSFGSRIRNLIALLITISLMTGPLWYFIPWSLTPLSTTFGKLRYVNAIFLVHISLLCWPITAYIGMNLLRFKLSREWIKMAVLMALCWWQALESSFGVYTVWTRFFHWISA